VNQEVAHATAEAIEQARRLIEGQEIELWTERFIVRLPEKQD
jgi:hypothetical protein